MWLKHVHSLSLCLTVEGTDGSWVMGMQSTSSLVEHTACSQEELLLCWGIVLGSSPGTLDVLVPAARGGAEGGRMCPSVWVLQQGDASGCPSPAALSTSFGEPLSSTVPWDVYPVPFPARNILCMVWPEEIIILQHLLWAQPAYLGALSQAGDGSGNSTAVSPTWLCGPFWPMALPRPAGICSVQGLCSCSSLWCWGISWS